METTNQPTTDDNQETAALTDNAAISQNPQTGRFSIDTLQSAKASGANVNILLNSFKETEYQIRNLPPDFIERFANKLILINDGQSTRREAINTIQLFIRKHINTPQMYQEFFKILYHIEEIERDENIPILIWTSLFWSNEVDNNYLKTFFNWLIHANKNDLKFLDFNFQDNQTNVSRRYISDAVIAICDTCLMIIPNSKDKGFEYARNIFAGLFRIESEINNFIKRQKNNPDFLNQSVATVYQGENRNQFLFNEMLKYLSMAGNGYYASRHSITAQQHAQKLFEMLNKVKLQMINDLYIQIESGSKLDEYKLIKNRNANQTEIQNASALFKVNLRYFRDEVRYNPHYIMTEYMRVFLFLFSMALGFLGGMLGILEYDNMSPVQGIIICALMIGYTVLIHTRKFYGSILPEDKYYLMQQSLPSLCANIERFSILQLQDFLDKQIIDEDNKNIFIYIPNFLHFLTSTYRTKVFQFISTAELRKVLFKTNEKITKLRWELISR